MIFKRGLVLGDAVGPSGNAKIGSCGGVVYLSGRKHILTCEHLAWENGSAPPIGRSILWKKRPRPGRPLPSTDWDTAGDVASISSNSTSDLGVADSILIKAACPVWLKPIRQIMRAFQQFPNTKRVTRISLEPMNPVEALERRVAAVKLGVTTGVTAGIVEDMPTRIKVAGNSHVPPIVHPRPLTIVGYNSWFCEEGDSGSLVWSTLGNGVMRPLGLLCATSLGIKGFVIPLSRIQAIHGFCLDK